MTNEQAFLSVCGNAVSETAYCFGDDVGGLEDYAWYNDPGSGTQPGGLKPPNDWDLHDMHGNVEEWVADWYGNYRTGAVVDPQGPDTGRSRVLRGGGWYNFAESCRAASRNWGKPDARLAFIGFRLVLFLEP